MLNERCIMAGFGGQGIMLMGQLVAQAGMFEDLNVSWLPSYGPEMRGGTANCAVIVSEKEIASPIISQDASSIIIMNLPSLAKFEPELVPGGIALINSSLISEKVKRQDVKAVYIPVSELANELGNTKVSNMIMLGAFVEMTGCVKPESILKAMEKKLGVSKAHLMDLNRAAFEAGAKAAREQK
ncbi:2-oxoacid:acceptor oxidoreductase family protein [Guggenheimella bovis]